MMAEEIYPYIKDDTEKETHDEHLYGKDSDSRKDSSQQSEAGDSSDGEEQGGGGSGGKGQHELAPPEPMSEAEKEQLSIQWRQRLAGAAQQAMQAGKLGGNLKRLVDHLLQPQLPWRMLLARYMTATSRDDYSYMRPSRREGSAIFPTLRSSQVDVLVVLDTSGSIRAAEMREFVSEINAIKGQMRARIVLHACDYELSQGGPWVFEPWEEFTLPDDIRGGGGTRFSPVFRWLDEAAVTPNLLVYFTDAEGEFPKQEPAFPVIWLVKGRAEVPWGQRIQLN
jgi:predicted metal-dependent peptidase